MRPPFHKPPPQWKAKSIENESQQIQMPDLNYNLGLCATNKYIMLMLNVSLIVGQICCNQVGWSVSKFMT